MESTGVASKVANKGVQMHLGTGNIQIGVFVVTLTLVAQQPS